MHLIEFKQSEVMQSPQQTYACIGVALDDQTDGQAHKHCCVHLYSDLGHRMFTYKAGGVQTHLAHDTQQHATCCTDAHASSIVQVVFEGVCVTGCVFQRLHVSKRPPHNELVHVSVSAPAIRSCSMRRRCGSVKHTCSLDVLSTVSVECR